MSDKTTEIDGVTVFELAPDGPPLASERDAVDVLGRAFSHSRGWIAIPKARLTADFFHLRTRIAGEMLQKFVNYGYRVAIVGDIAAEIMDSDALRDFVYESNRGKHVWFVDTMDTFAEKLRTV